MTKRDAPLRTKIEQNAIFTKLISIVAFPAESLSASLIHTLPDACIDCNPVPVFLLDLPCWFVTMVAPVVPLGDEEVGVGWISFDLRAILRRGRASVDTAICKRAFGFSVAFPVR